MGNASLLIILMGFNRWLRDGINSAIIIQQFSRYNIWQTYETAHYFEILTKNLLDPKTNLADSLSLRDQHRRVWTD